MGRLRLGHGACGGRRPALVVLAGAGISLLVFAACKTSGSRLSNRHDSAAPYTHELAIAEDAYFKVESQTMPRWVKFMIKLDDPGKVYFQNSNTYAFHHEFAKDHLPGYTGITREEFDAISLKRDGQKLLVGAVIVPMPPSIPEYGVQFVGLDPYPAEWLAPHYQTVRAAIRHPDSGRFRDFYMPVFEQQDAVKGQTDTYAKHEIEVSDLKRWLQTSECYAAGWAYGRLREIPADRIEEAYASGELRPDDILLTSGVPAEIPPVRGVLTLSPATPNSHPVILAQSFGIPFAYLASAEEQSAARAHRSKTVAVELAGVDSVCNFRIKDLTGHVDAGVSASLAALKAPAALKLQRATRAGVTMRDVASLQPKDVAYFGGKATGFAVLREAVPDHAPVAHALPFDHWFALMDQLHNGRPLGAYIEEMLAPFDSYPPDIRQVKAALREIRDVVAKAPMPAENQRAILEALQAAGFDARRKIRFRSSTNVEDTETFSGAGLYDSYSGCLADDLDHDDRGPSACNPEEPKEKGVIRAILKVYASFYNDNAFLERLRHGIRERDVGMAVLVHYSFPDEDEYANGVLTIERRGWATQVKIVSQPGATSVTNPDPGARPEVANGIVFGEDLYLSFAQRSGLLPLGRLVLGSEERYQELYALAVKAANEFEKRHPSLEDYMLDFEYKLVAPDELTLKQVRLVPRPVTARLVAPHILGGEAQLCVYQGENSASSVFANQRLMSKFRLRVRPGLLSDARQSLYTNARIDFVDVGGQPFTYSGALAGLSGYAFQGTEKNHAGDLLLKEGWTLELEKGQPLKMVLASQVPEAIDARLYMPLVFPEDIKARLEATYAKPQLHLGFEGLATTSEDYVSLRSCPPASKPEGATRQERTLNLPGGVKVATTYWYPPLPKGPTAGYTAPLLMFEQTTITGLTQEPITLKSYYAQAFAPEHHNFAEHFVFNLLAEPGLSAATKRELAEKDVLAIYTDFSKVTKLIGRNGPRDP